MIETQDIEEHRQVLLPWELNLRQISPGPFRACLEYVQANGLLFYREHYSHRVMGLGATPAGCRSNTKGEQACLWYLDKTTYGHGTIVTSLRARSGSKVKMRCVFPLDGHPRAPESCVASIDE